MIRLMVRAHRPHCGLHPRQPYTWPAVRGVPCAERAVRTSWSLNTLQEQTIMWTRIPGGSVPYSTYPKHREGAKLIAQLYMHSNLEAPAVFINEQARSQCPTNS